MPTESGLTDTELARLLGRDPSAPKWDRLLVEPDASPEPEPVEPPESAPVAERIAFWEQAAMWAKTSAEHAVAVSTLARLRSGSQTAGEPTPKPAWAPPPGHMRSVLVREVLARDEAGRILRTKEWVIDEPLMEC